MKREAQAAQAFLQRRPDPRGRVTLLESEWIACQLCHILVMQPSKEYIQDFLGQLGIHCQESLDATENEVLYGRAGAIQVILFLRSHFNDSLLGSQLAVSLATEIIQAGLDSNESKSLMWSWHNKHYLGAAHVVVGILHTLLLLDPQELAEVSQALGRDVFQLIEAKILSLNDYCFPSGNLDSSIVAGAGGSLHSTDRLVHWCHGATGHVLLLVRAAQVFRHREKEFIQQACRTGENVVWKRGLLRKGVGLCHGISGNAYALLALVRATKDQIWIQRAEFFADFCLKNLDRLKHVPDRPYSVYEGMGGLALLLMELADPMSAAFPLYDYS